MDFPNILIGISAYGVIELNQNSEVLWEYKLENPQRVYGLDYDFRNKYVLVGLHDKIAYINKISNNYFGEITLYDASLHSVRFAGGDTDRVIVTDAAKDIIYLFNLRDNISEYINLRNYFTMPKDLHEWGIADWIHPNFAQLYGDEIFITLYRHPTDKNINGALLILDAHKFTLKKMIEKNLYKPHYVIPDSADPNMLIIANTGTEAVDIMSRKSGAVYWTYHIPDEKSYFEVDESRSPVAYALGAHYLEQYEYKGVSLLLMLIPNLRLARFINLITGETIHEYKIPKYIYKEAGIGEDPRPFQAKLIY